MSNPTVGIGNTIDPPPDPSITRVLWTRVIFNEQEFFIYAPPTVDGGDSERDIALDFGSSVFQPGDKGSRSFFFALLIDTDVPSPLCEFISDEAWTTGGLQYAPSAVLSVRKSILQKLIIPTQYLIANGWTNLSKYFAYTWHPTDGTQYYGFNWTLNAPSAGDDELAQILKRSMKTSESYASVTYVDDSVSQTTIRALLSQPAIADVPKGNWRSGSDGQLVGNGAFALMVNVTPSFPSGTPPEESAKNPWRVYIEAGDDIVMKLQDGGALDVTISNTGDPSTDRQTTKVQLNDAQSKEKPPQGKKMPGTIPFLIVAFPVWNGIVIASGIQDTPGLVTNVSSQFCPKKKGLDIAQYVEDFDLDSPAHVLVPSAGNIVDFGSYVQVSSLNCHVELAYLPCFFWPSAEWDTWFLINEDTFQSTYSYDAYIIWTNNGLPVVAGAIPIETDTGKDAPPGGKFAVINWSLETPKADRYSPEIFGYILRTEEERDFVSKTGNGSFALDWVGGDPGGPTPASWSRYIQSVSVTTAISDNGSTSSGTITVDKYGLAGYNASVIQDIGAITISASGGESTFSGVIFQGLAMGISDQDSADSNVWTIPLVGLEMKMQDIKLVRPPFFDGYLLANALNFLCRYGGITPDYTYAPNAGTEAFRLPSSQDIEIAVLDYKTGTSVMDAINGIMGYAQHAYVVRDGRIYFYERDSSGMPVWLSNPANTARQLSHPDSKIQTIDRTPDFDDIRNEIVIVGLSQVTGGTETDLKVPLQPQILTINQSTTPDIPWSRPQLEAVPGAVSRSIMQNYAEAVRIDSSIYRFSGRTTVRGDARIKPYDRWSGTQAIVSVTHNLDFQAKTWTTDLELADTVV